jgi:putative endonuclease
MALLLRPKGHRIVAQRYRTPVGEIDLVALKGRRLAFIEVKRRKTKEDAAWTLARQAAAKHRESRPILARRPSRLCGA